MQSLQVVRAQECEVSTGPAPDPNQGGGEVGAAKDDDEVLAVPYLPFADTPPPPTTHTHTQAPSQISSCSAAALFLPPSRFSQIMLWQRTSWGSLSTMMELEQKGLVGGGGGGLGPFGGGP